MEKVLNDVVIRGVKNIEKVNLRKIHGYKHYNPENGNYEKKDIYVLDTIGTNLLDILAFPDIDVNKTFSNDIMEVYAVLGIEAARKCLFNEIIDVMEFDSTYINHHHMHLLCDRMACNEKMVSIFRHGINKDNIGPIAKASFEETTEMFLQAAKHGELDNMRGVSANIMCGQNGFYGTSSFRVFVDTNELFKKYEGLPERKENFTFQEESNMIDMTDKSPEEVMDDFKEKQENEYDACSIHKLKMENSLSENMVKNVVIEDDDGYDLDI
jgi:DNA-directed RNA polymerase II subunit RPB1